MFSKKIVSDALLATVKEVTSGEQTDSTGNQLLVGDGVTVQEGPHEGRTGTISGFHNTGRSEVQLNHGPSVAIYNEVLLNEDRVAAVRESSKFGITKKLIAATAARKKTADDQNDRHRRAKLTTVSTDTERHSRGEAARRKANKGQRFTYEELVFDHYILDHLLAEAGFDAIDKKALKKKWKDREDQDIDNDGDEDESDRFLHKRRKAITKSKKKNGLGNGEKIEINPEIQEKSSNSRIVKMIKNSIRQQRGLIENENDSIYVGTTKATQNYKDATPGQSDSELPPDAFDYTKYNVDNLIVPDEELDAILDKGSYLRPSNSPNR